MELTDEEFRKRLHQKAEEMRKTPLPPPDPNEPEGLLAGGPQYLDLEMSEELSTPAESEEDSKDSDR